MDRIRRNIISTNAHIEEHRAALNGVKDQEGMDLCITRLTELIEETRAARKALGRHIGFHRIEIDRIVEKRWQMDGVCPEVAKNLPGDDYWDTLYRA